MKPSRILSLFAAVWVTVGASLMAGDLALGHHYTDDMVLQREKPVLIRGTAAKGATVTVGFSGQSKAAQADDAGEWSVTLDPLPASAEGKTLTVSSSTPGQAADIKNVVVGDVFLFARQTTIDVNLGRDETGRNAATDLPSVRVLTIKTLPATTPQKTLAQEATRGWTTLDKKAALGMDAAAFHLAKGLSGQDVPIGIIDVNLGKHFPIAWMSREALLETTAIYLNLTDEHVVAEVHEKTGSGAGGRSPTWSMATSRNDG